MNRIIVDEALKAKLDGLKEPLTLCDEQGNALAYVTPAVEASVYECLESPNSEEELARREREGKGRPLADILGDLENQK